MDSRGDYVPDKDFGKYDAERAFSKLKPILTNDYDSFVEIVKNEFL